MRTTDEHAIATAIIALMNGVVYRETAEDTWSTLNRRAGAVREHFTAIGVDVIVDDVEAYAYLRSQEPADDEQPLPRLVARRSLSFNLSLLLVLLRKRLVEFESSTSDSRLVLSREQIVDMLRLFLAGSPNDARVVEQIDRSIGKATELGFLRAMPHQKEHWEVRRILKAYVDAATLSDFADKLQEYAESVGGDSD
jgi:hypothetical protein